MKLEPVELERQLREKADELKTARQKAAAAMALAQSLKRKAAPFLASLKNGIKQRNPEKSEEAIKREAEGSDAYNNHIIGLCAAEAEANQAEADMEGLQDQFRAIQSALSYEKALIQERIYSTGGR